MIDMSKLSPTQKTWIGILILVAILVVYHMQPSQPAVETEAVNSSKPTENVIVSCLRWRNPVGLTDLAQRVDYCHVEFLKGIQIARNVLHQKITDDEAAAQWKALLQEARQKGPF